MIRNARIGNILYYVSDLDRTARFYGDILGLDVQRMPDDGNGNPWLLACIPNNTDLLFFQGEVKPGNSPVIVFELAQGGIDDVVAGLAEAGVTIVTPVSHAPGGWSADCLDPDGYTLSFYQSEEVARSRRA